MKISIITASFNSEKTIKDTIDSVACQSYSPIEYIIVDGGSRDKTGEIVASYGIKISKFISEPDKGIYDAMNKGIKMATGEVVGILNSDDFYIDSDVIANIAACFKDGVDGVYADLVYVDPIDTDRILRTWHSKEYKTGDFLKGWMPPHPTFFVRKSAYEKFGCFTDKLKSAADYELMLRLIHKEQIKVVHFPKVIVKMRAGGASNASIRNRIKANLEDRRAWKLNEIKPGLFTLLRKPLSKFSQFLKK